jgi:hypothetical protein
MTALSWGIAAGILVPPQASLNLTRFGVASADAVRLPP